MVQVAGDGRTSDSSPLIALIMRPRYGMSEWVEWNAELHPILTHPSLIVCFRASSYIRTKDYWSLLGAAYTK